MALTLLWVWRKALKAVRTCSAHAGGACCQRILHTHLQEWTAIPIILALHVVCASLTLTNGVCRNTILVIFGFLRRHRRNIRWGKPRPCWAIELEDPLPIGFILIVHNALGSLSTAMTTSLWISPRTTPDVLVNGANTSVLSCIPPPVEQGVCPQTFVQWSITATLDVGIFVVQQSCDNGSDIHKSYGLDGHIATITVIPFPSSTSIFLIVITWVASVSDGPTAVLAPHVK